jgi:HAD superfamily hydrolase (TIGR01549 family)
MIRVGLKLPEDLLLRELNEVITEFSSNYGSHFDKLLVRIPPESYEGLNPTVLVAAAVAAYHDTKFKQLRPYSDVKESLEQLSKTGLILGIITAGPPVKQAEKLVRLGILPYINQTAIFISEQIGISKPNVKLYRWACTKTGVVPGEAMYIGDNPVNDIDPPNRIGMITVRNRRSGKYSGIEGETKPHYEIQDFCELLNILRLDFGVEVRPC